MAKCLIKSLLLLIPVLTIAETLCPIKQTMPCNPVEYPEQTEIEKEIIKILYIQDELSGKPINYSFGHPRTKEYELTQLTLTTLTVELCSRIQSFSEIDKSSDRLQDWWIAHRIQDHKRLKINLKKSENQTNFIAKLNQYDKDNLDFGTLSKSLVNNRLNSVRWKLNVLESEENVNRKNFIYGEQFLRTNNVLFILINIETAENLQFNTFKIKNLDFNNLLSFFERTLNTELQSVLNKKELETLRESIEINNLHSGYQQKHKGASILSSTLEQLNIKPLEESFIMDFIEIIEKITGHNTTYS